MVWIRGMIRKISMNYLGCAELMSPYTGRNKKAETNHWILSKLTCSFVRSGKKSSTIQGYNRMLGPEKKMWGISQG